VRLRRNRVTLPREPEDHETVLSEAERAALARAVSEKGEGVVAVAASVHRATVARAVAGFPLRRGSAVLVRGALKRGGWLE